MRGARSASVEVGRRVATGLHQVDGPAFDAAGNLYATVSGTRGQRVPVSIFKVTADGAQQPLASGIVNATSLAFDPFGDLCVSSRFDGTVYRVKTDGTVEKVASDLGVACGLAFTPGRHDVRRRPQRHAVPRERRRPGRSRSRRCRRASRPSTWPSAPDEAVYVSGPTLSTCDVVYRVDRRGEITVFAEGFGRPQGLAVDAHGRAARRRSAGRRERRLPDRARRAPRADGVGRRRRSAWPSTRRAASPFRRPRTSYLFDAW